MGREMMRSTRRFRFMMISLLSVRPTDRDDALLSIISLDEFRYRILGVSFITYQLAHDSRHAIAAALISLRLALPDSRTPLTCE